MNQLQMLESQPLRCPMIEENAQACALFSAFPRRARKSRTVWRMLQSDANCSPGREFAGNIPILGGVGHYLSGKSLLVLWAFCANSLESLAGNFFERAGNFVSLLTL
jgi:hypothetical protein